MNSRFFNVSSTINSYRIMSSNTLQVARRVPRVLASPLSTGAHADRDTLLRSFAELRKKLKDPLHKHVTKLSGQSDGDVTKCPFLAQQPVQLRAAQRETNARTYNRRFPLTIVKAQGAVLTDDAGREYIDCLAGAGTLNLGHNHPVQTEAAIKHLQSGSAQQLLDLHSPVKDEFVTELFETLPAYSRPNGNEWRVQFCSPAGADATEAAVKLCKKSTGCTAVLCFSGGYHGQTSLALSMMGNLAPKQGWGPVTADVHHLPYPYAYRCPFGIGERGHEVISTYIERLLDDVESGITKPACVIIEAVQGEGGGIPAPIPFLQRLRAVTERHNIPLILDEVQAGFARTGKQFAFEHAGIVPDVVCMAKAVGGGFPLALITYNGAKLDWGPGAHAGTFRGNQLAMVTGAASMRYVREQGSAFLDEVTAKGERFMAAMRDLQKRCALIGDVRGRGMMCTVEIVDPRGERDSIGALPYNGEATAGIQMRMFARGVIMERAGRHYSNLRLLCPLVTTNEQLDEIIEVMSTSILEEAKEWE